MSGLKNAVVDVFVHLINAANATTYPLERHLRLADAIARDVAARLVTLLQVYYIYSTAYLNNFSKFRKIR